MRSIKGKTRKKKIIIIAIAIILLGSGSVGAYMALHNSSDSDSSKKKDESSGTKTDSNPPSQEQIDAGNQQKQQTAGDASKPSSTPSDAPATNPTGQLGVTITAANQNGSVINIRTLINEIVSSGTCTLTLQKGSQIVRKIASVQALANSSTCQGFDIPTSELSGGAWQLTVAVSAGGKSGSATQTITIQ